MRFQQSPHLATFLLLCTSVLLPDAPPRKNDSAVAIIAAGVQSAEDASFVSPGYRFFPGDFVYGTFQITSFARNQASSEAPPRVSLKYAATLEDSNGLPMAAPESGEIETELSSEDKNWTPKRRFSFMLPPFIGAGRARIRIVVKDLIGSTEDSRLLPVVIGGVTIMRSDAVTVQNLQFLRRENDAEGLDVPAFSPGDSIYARFNISGFKTDPENRYRVTYDMLVLKPDGKPFIQQIRAAELTASSFYPAQFLPATLQLTTSGTSAKGVYPVTLTVHDLIGNVTSQSKASFTLE